MISDQFSAISNEGGNRCVHYERDTNEPPSVAVAAAIADFWGEDPGTSKIRLYDYVDPDALDALFAETYSGADRTVGRVHFEVEDATVVVRPESVRVY